MTIAAAILESVTGETPILQDVRAKGLLNDLMLNMEVEQTYRNASKTNIEAVYTFPLPLDAVLLGFRVEIGDRNLFGRIVEKSVGEETYEDAITDGDTAILLEQIRPGMYSASVGNLMPGETARIAIDYALMLRWNGNKVRIHIPTTLAPFYGDPGAAGLQPHQTPEYSLTDERGFHLHIDVRGLLQDAQFRSASHSISIGKTDIGTRIDFQPASSMDRDFILEATSDTEHASGCLVARDLDGWVALASFRPEIPESQASRIRRCSKIVVDCSGSMGGDSIAQARVALDRILDSLRDGDFFNIIAFGSHHKGLFQRETKVSADSLGRARHFVSELDADMGGTEISGALDAAYVGSEPKGFWNRHETLRDVLLITDGEVWDTESVIVNARKSRHRIFTVGVGSAVQESFLRPLAEETGGACELVSPNEDMAERIHRHFQRMHAAAAAHVQVNWPAEPRLAIPEQIRTIFAGDTLHAMAWFPEKPQGTISLDVTLADGRVIPQSAQFKDFTDNLFKTGEPDPEQATSLARMAAARKLDTIEDETEATDLAVRYQLVSENTNCIVLDVRAVGKKAENLPELRKVPQVLAGGWGGMGSVDLKLRSPDVQMDISPEAFAQQGYSGSIQCDERVAALTAGVGDSDIVAALNDISSRTPVTLAELTLLGLASEILEALFELVAQGHDEESVVAAYLHLFADTDVGRLLERNALRKIRKTFKAAQPGANVLDAVSIILTSV